MSELARCSVLGTCFRLSRYISSLILNARRSAQHFCVAAWGEHCTWYVFCSLNVFLCSFSMNAYDANTYYRAVLTVPLRSVIETRRCEQTVNSAVHVPN